MPRQEVSIKTRDGICPASIFTPADTSGPWPAVIFFMDGFGIRPALFQMSQHLADAGYLVLLPDLYYRFGDLSIPTPAEVMADLRAGASASPSQFLTDLVTTQATHAAGTEAAGFMIERSAQGVALKPVAHIRNDNASADIRQAAINAFANLMEPSVEGGKDAVIQLGDQPDRTKEPQFCLITLLRADNQVIAVSGIITRCRDVDHAQQRLKAIQVDARSFEHYEEGRSLAITPRKRLTKLISSLGRDRKVSDAGAFIDFLSSRPDVKGKRFGATGYCLGGNVALTAAGGHPDRFAAVASFHGVNLASDQPDSPHLFVKNIAGRVYVAGAVEDASFTDEQKGRLEKALTDANVDHQIETYPGARHGFAVPDHLSFNPTAAERHWSALLKLFHETLAPKR